MISIGDNNNDTGINNKQNKPNQGSFNKEEEGGRQSLITLSPGALMPMKEAKTKEEDEIEVEELQADSKEIRDQPSIQQEDDSTIRPKEQLQQQLIQQPRQYQPINKNSTIKNIVGYKPKSKLIINSTDQKQQLNDAIDPESNMFIEEDYEDEESKKKVPMFNLNEDKNKSNSNYNQGQSGTGNDPNYIDYQSRLNEVSNFNQQAMRLMVPIEKVNTNDNNNENNDDNNNDNENNDVVIEANTNYNNNNYYNNDNSNKFAMQPNSISNQEHITLGGNNTKANIGNSLNNSLKYNNNDDTPNIINNTNINNNIQHYNYNDSHQKVNQTNILITSIPKIKKRPPPAFFNINTNLPYHHQKNPQVPLSKLQLAENKYIFIKDSLSKLFNYVDSIEDESTIDYNAHIEKMLTYLEQLNQILTVLISSQKASKLAVDKSITSNANSKRKLASSNSKKQLDQIESANTKLLNTYEKQYQSLKARYDQISDSSYILNIQQQSKQLDEKISFLEAENRQLRTNQIISENIFIKKMNDESNTNRLKKMANEAERYQLEYDKILRRIDANQIIIKDNETKIELLLERERELKRNAKEKYDLEEFDNIKQIEKKEKEKEEKIQKYKKKIQILNHAYKSNQVKYSKEIEDNQKTIAQLENDRNELMELLHQKKGMPSEVTMILDTNNGYNGNNYEKDYYNNNNNNNLSSINSVSVVPGVNNSVGNSHSLSTSQGQVQNQGQGNRRYHFNQTVPDNNENRIINKEMVLKELEKKQKEEEIMHNMSLDDPKVNTSIVLKKIALKPNFSFNKKPVNEVNKGKTGTVSGSGAGDQCVCGEKMDEAIDENKIIEEINEEKRRLVGDNEDNNDYEDNPLLENAIRENQYQNKDEDKESEDQRKPLPIKDKNYDVDEDIQVNINEDEYDENEHEQEYTYKKTPRKIHLI